MKSSITHPISKKHRHVRLAAAAALALAGLAPEAWAAKAKIDGAKVVKGAASFRQDGDLTRITASNRAIINYKQFDVPSGASVQFIQPGARATVLNRIQSAVPSRIDGSISANGQVFFVNPSGVIFGKGADVKAAGFTAAAANISNENFLRGVYKFDGARGPVTNDGTIEAGQVHLFGQQVSNGGSISAEGGLVTLSTGSGMYVGERNGTTMVKVEAGNGPVGPRTGAVGDLYSLAIRQGGSVKAKQVIAQANGGVGTAKIAGTIDASAADGKGGAVTVTGKSVSLTGAKIDASGPAGGGKILIGGDYKGSGDLPQARTTVVDAASTLMADATVKGNGGTIVVWSDGVTNFHGKATARGGPQGGNGGLVETSGHLLSVTGASVDASAGPGGTAGQWLLDPINVFIGDPVALQGQFESFNDPSTAYARINPSSDPNAEFSFIDVADIEATLNSGTSVTVEALALPAAVPGLFTDGRVRNPGQIYVASVIDKTAGGDATLTLYGPRRVRFAGNEVGQQVNAAGTRLVVAPSGVVGTVSTVAGVLTFTDTNGVVVGTRQVQSGVVNVTGLNPLDVEPFLYVRTLATSGINATVGKLNVVLKTDDVPPIVQAALTELDAMIGPTNNFVEPAVPGPLYRYSRDVLNFTGGTPGGAFSAAAGRVRDQAEQVSGQIEFIGAQVRTNGGDFTVTATPHASNRRLANQISNFLTGQGITVNGPLPLHRPDGTLVNVPAPTGEVTIETGGGAFSVDVPRAITITTPLNTAGGAVTMTTTGPYGGGRFGNGNIQITSSPILITRPVNSGGGNVTLSSTFDIQPDDISTGGGSLVIRADTLNGLNQFLTPTPANQLPQLVGGRGKFKLTGVVSNDAGGNDQATIDTDGGSIEITSSQNTLNGDVFGGPTIITSDPGPVDVNASRKEADGVTILPEREIRVGSGLVFQQAGNIDTGTSPLTITGTDIVFAGTSISGGAQTYIINDKSRGAATSLNERRMVVVAEDRDKRVFFRDQIDPATRQPRANAVPINYDRRFFEPTGQAGDLGRVRNAVDFDFPVDHADAPDATPAQMRANAALRVAELMRFKSFNPSDIIFASSKYAIDASGPIVFTGAVVGTGGASSAGTGRTQLSINTTGTDVTFQKAVGGPLALDINTRGGNVTFAGGVGRIPYVSVSAVNPGLGNNGITFSVPPENFRLESLPISIDSLSVKAGTVTFGSDTTPTYSGQTLPGPVGDRTPSTGDVFSSGRIAVDADRIVLRGNSPVLATNQDIIVSTAPTIRTTGARPLFGTPKASGDLSNKLPTRGSTGSQLVVTGAPITIQAIGGGNAFGVGAGFTGSTVDEIAGLVPVELTTQRVQVRAVQFPRAVAEVIAGANPPIIRRAERVASVSGSQKEDLAKLGINARDLGTEETLESLLGRSAYNDYPGKDVSPEEYTIASPRIPSAQASVAVEEYRVLRDEQEPRRNAVKAAWDEYGKSVGEAAKPTGVGFRQYLESQQPAASENNAQALDTLDRLKRLQGRIEDLALNPAYRPNAERALINSFLPEGVPYAAFRDAIRGEAPQVAVTPAAAPTPEGATPPATPTP